MLLTLAFALTCTLVGSVRLSGADGGGGRKARGRVLRVALVGDPQVDDSTEMGYARRSVYRELYGRRDLDVCIFLGDLVNDNMSLLPESVGVVDSLPYQCFMVPGNHDRDVYRGPKSSMYRQRDLSTWRKAVGYVDTSFVRGNVRFVLMNNVRPSDSGMTDYVGGFTDRQKHWLDSVLVADRVEARSRRISSGGGTPALTMLATHIPFSQMKGRDSVLALIPDISRLLFVSGHTHFVSRDDSIPELIAGAACGSWWRGVRDSNGIPYALQSCGSPRATSLPTFIVTELMTCPISASAGRLLNSCPHGRFRMTLPVVLIVCISMSSAVRQTASSASPGLDVKLILVSGVLWLPRKWSR